MVKVSDKTQRDETLLQKTSKLVEIAGQVLKNNRKRPLKGRYDINVVGDIMISLRHSASGSLWVNPATNEIYVDSSIYFEDAMHVANAYELFTKEEFTVRKNY